jgi:hypothetical protein
LFEGSAGAPLELPTRKEVAAFAMSRPWSVLAALMACTAALLTTLCGCTDGTTPDCEGGACEYPLPPAIGNEGGEGGSGTEAGSPLNEAGPTDAGNG